MKKILYIIMFVLVSSCSNVEFVYNDNSSEINPLYEKTEVKISGVDLVFIKSYMQMFFGENKDNEFDLLIDVKEKKTKRSIETNQTTSNLTYELRFYYNLFSNSKSCTTFKKVIVSSFTITPKSAGYNYGTDSSLEKKYQLAITDNLNQFMSYISSLNTNNCQ